MLNYKIIFLHTPVYIASEKSPKIQVKANSKSIGKITELIKIIITYKTNYTQNK